MLKHSYLPQFNRRGSLGCSAAIKRLPAGVPGSSAPGGIVPNREAKPFFQGLPAAVRPNGTNTAPRKWGLVIKEALRHKGAEEPGAGGDGDSPRVWRNLRGRAILTVRPRKEEHSQITPPQRTRYGITYKTVPASGTALRRFRPFGGVPHGCPLR